MANLFEHKDRRVVPNWRSFNQTIVLGELNSPQKHENIINQVSNIENYIADWKNHKTIAYAADLISAGVVNDNSKNPFVIDAAKYILSNQNVATNSQISLANFIIYNSVELDYSKSFFDITLDKLPTLVDPISVSNKINNIRQSLKIFMYNPIYYVELSRYYSILGQEDKSIWAMKTALHLAPNNRFVLRCASRLFAHYHQENNDYLQFAHYILKKSPLTAIDPWLASAEISISTIRNKPSTFIKKGLELINSKNISPFSFTELASSIGTVELLYGSHKKSRDLYNKSLICPNDNSLAQIEWASSKDKQLNVDPNQFQVKLNFEALALKNYFNNKIDLALENTVKWYYDMPFSKRPIIFGSNIACTILKDQNKAISFLNAGLKSHPNDPQIINNIAYSLALDNKPQEAFDFLNRIKNSDYLDNITQICIIATKGLSNFRSSNFEIGRQLYWKAIELTNQIKNQELLWVALLNYAREEILIDSEYVESVIELISQIPSDSDDIQIRTLKNDVIDLYKVKKSQG